MNNKTVELVRKYVAKNRLDYGSAKYGIVMKKVISENPLLKSDLKLLETEVKKIVDEINVMPEAEVMEIYKKYGKEFEEAREIKLKKTSSANIDIEGAIKGEFITRFPPEPNGPMHIGHAKALFLEKKLAERYEGKVFLYFDDTNPSKEKQEFVDMFMVDLEWLGVRFDDIYYASDNIEKIYEYGRRMIKDGNAYVCLCRPEEIKRRRSERSECEHRNINPKRDMILFEEMISGKHNNEGYIVRFRGNMGSDNTTMRDPVIFRIIEDSHYRQNNKYVLWPKYEINTPIVDSIHGVTHAIRSKEFELEDELYYKILDQLNLRKPILHIISRLVINNNVTSKREIMKLINNKDISGYDDPRLITIAGLRRRGIVPEAIRSFVLKFGMGKGNSKVNFSMLLEENRRVIDRTAKRIFYVGNPVLVDIGKIINSNISLHPVEDMGSRKYTTSKVYISGKDAESLKVGDIIRLKNLCCIKIKDKKEWIIAIPSDIIPDEIITIQWVPENDYLKCKIIIPSDLLENGEFDQKSLGFSEGFIEGYAKIINKGEIVQLERFGFAILDKKKNMEFVFTSK